MKALEEGQGEGIRILVLDSGVETSHPHFKSRTIPAFSLLPHEGDRWEVVPDPSGDAFGHGTAVAGILHDLAPGCEIHSLRVLGADLRAAGEAILAGLDWGITERYDILNCSFGTSSIRWLPAFKQRIDRAYMTNTWIVSAANSVGIGQTDLPSQFPTVFGTQMGPSDLKEIRYVPGQLVDFMAPGEQVRVPWKCGEYRVCTGSSFAAPFLAAQLARLFCNQGRPTGVVGKAMLQNLCRDGRGCLPRG